MRNADPKSNRSLGALSDVFIDAAVDAINQTGETVKNPLFSVPLKRDTVQARLVRYKSRDRRINHPVAFLSYMALNCRSRSIIGVTLNRLRETRVPRHVRASALEAENPASDHRLPLRNRSAVFPDLPSFFYSPPPGDRA